MAVIRLSQSLPKKKTSCTAFEESFEILATPQYVSSNSEDRSAEDYDL